MEQMPKKISQIKLSNFTYDIDVANNLKATKLIGEQLTKVAPVEAILKPDGQYYFFDENNKISSHYISDTILGQLKFGGTISYLGEIGGKHEYSMTPSSLLRAQMLAKAPEGTSILIPRLIIELQNLPAEDWCHCEIPAYNSALEQLGAFTLDLEDLEGFYFIYRESQQTAPELKNSAQDIIVPKFEVGDWFLTCGEAIQKIDNTDTITHIEDASASLLSIEGSGLKLNKLTKTDEGIAFEGSLESTNTDPNADNTIGIAAEGVNLTKQFATTGRQASMEMTANSGLTFNSDTVYVQGATSTFSAHGLALSTGIHDLHLAGGIGLLNKNNDTGATTQVGFGVITIDNADTSTEIDGGTITTSSLEATAKMTAPTPDGTDKKDVVNIDYFENNATKVDWTNIDSEVHVVNQHNIEVDGVVTAGGLNVGDIVTVTDKVLVDGDLQVTGDLSFGAESHLVFGTIEGTDFIADHAKVTSDPVEDTDVVNKAYLEAYIASLGGVGGSYPAAEDYTF